MTPATWGWIGRANVRVVPLSKGEIALVSAEDYERAAMFKWHLLSERHRYAASWLKVDGKQVRVLLHQLIMEAPADRVTDHINWDGLDCRRTNMRVVTNSENIRNRRRQGVFGGVVWIPILRRWQVRLRVGGKTQTFGYYRTRDEAERAADDAAREMGISREARPAEATRIAVCPECNLPFTAMDDASGFCSRRCENKRDTRERRPGRDRDPKVCVECGVEFTPRHGRQKYCGEKCRNAVGYRKWATFGAEWRAANAGRFREYQREYQAKKRAEKAS